MGFSRAEPGKISAGMEAASRADRRRANKANPDSHHNRKKAARANKREKGRAAKLAAKDGVTDTIADDKHQLKVKKKYAKPTSTAFPPYNRPCRSAKA